MTFITFACLIVALGWIALVNRFAYGISRNLSRKVDRHITRRYARRVFAIVTTYKNFRFVGDSDLLDELPPQYLVLSNHQSLLDIPVFMLLLGGERLRFIAKIELGNHVPLISLILKSDQHCLIERSGSPSAIMKSMDAFADRVRTNNWIPVLFPEGTRSLDGSLGKFHAAGFRRFEEKAPMPVAVCAVDGGWRVSSLKGMSQNLQDGRYHAKVLKIYPVPHSKAEAMHILEEGRELIQRQLEEWRNPVNCPVH